MKRQGLTKAERIKSKKDFEKIFSSGNRVFSENKKIKALYLIENESEQKGVKIAVAVSSKAGIAVWRNRIKRLIREAYRLNKNILLDVCLEKKILLKIAFSPNSLNEKNNKKIKLQDILPETVEILNKIKRNLL